MRWGWLEIREIGCGVGMSGGDGDRPYTRGRDEGE